MVVRTQISLGPDDHRKAREKAAQMGISLAEYFRRVIGRDLREEGPGADISLIFDLGASGQADVSSNIDKYVGEAAEAEYAREVGGSRAGS